jgi:FtsP/CotA-like multicopper oxidase with cupredoxin domain
VRYHGDSAAARARIAETMPPPFEQKPLKLVRKRLDAAGVDAHLAAVVGRAQAIEIRIKDAAAYHSEGTAEQLQEAGRRLRAGEIAAVQLRYFQDDVWWCDTVMRRGDSFRLVRMQQDEPA